MKSYICWYIRHGFNTGNMSLQFTFIFILLILKKIWYYTLQNGLFFHIFKARKNPMQMFCTFLIVICHLWDFQISGAFWRTECFKLYSSWQLKSILGKIQLFRCEVLTFVVRQNITYWFCFCLNFFPYFPLFGSCREHNFHLK